MILISEVIGRDESHKSEKPHNSSNERRTEP